MKKLSFALIAILATSLLLFVTAYAQTALDPLQGYRAFPDYLDHGCNSGNALWESYGPVADNDNGTVTQSFRFHTRCPGSGRGSVATVWQSCWAVSFDLDGKLLDRDLLAPYAHWKQGQAQQVCP